MNSGRRNDMSTSRARRRMARVLLGALVAGLLVPLAAAPAHACSCIGLPIAAQARQADAVFVGTITNRIGPAIGAGGVWSSTDPVTYTVAVDGVYKGSVRATEHVVSAASGASCGLEVKIDRRYVLFPRVDDRASTPPGGPEQLTGSLCDGTTRATPRVLGALQTTLGQPRPPLPGESAPPLVGGFESLLIFGALAWLVTVFG